jgi:Ca-activated chloride channel family protein
LRVGQELKQEEAVDHPASGEEAMKFFRRRAALISATCALLGLSMLSQSQSQQQSAPSSQQQPAVKLSVLVMDSKNNSVTDLRQEDFQIFENDSPQTISSFSKEDAPVSYGLLIDSSRSLEKQFTGVLRAGRTIIDANRPGDETFLVSFVSTDKLIMMQDFTTEKEVLRVKLNGLEIQGGATAIIDAVYTATEHLSKSKEGTRFRRHALVLITDGEDRYSYYGKDKLIKLLRNSDAQIFVIGLVNELDKQGGFMRQGSRERAVKLLEELAKETGGHAFFSRSSSDLETIATEIARSLHTQYVIGYTPPAGASKDSYRKVSVRLVDAPGRDKLKVIARPGYNVPRL